MVKEGDVLKVEKLPQPKKGNTITFDNVLLFNDGKKTNVGTPLVKDKKVSAEFIEEGKDKKVTVIKFKSKIRYNVKRGHRQQFTKVKITKL